jgi:hypothetical protein
MRSPAWAVLVVLLSARAPAQQSGHDTHAHEHGERLGAVRFPTSCAPAARPHFERGVALLHSFQYDESLKAFDAAAQADPRCAMAQWGVAMTLYHPIWAAGNPSAAPTPAELERGRAAVERAKALPAATDRERDYIEAIAAFYRDSERLDHATRAEAYARAMEQVARRHAQDPEASIFYAAALLGTAPATDKTYARQKKAAQILNAVLPKTRDHPGVAHYLIHSFDYPDLAQLALPAARAYAKIAPSSSHALHMPSHIFTRLALWPESIRSNLDSAAAARRSMARTRPGATHFDELHAMDYLVYAHLQRGEDKKADAVLAQMRAVKSLDVPNFAAAYAFAAAPVRPLLERRRWAEAAALRLSPPDFPWRNFAWAEAIVEFGRALGAARSADSRYAADSVANLARIRSALSEARDPYWADQVEVQRRAAAAWLARARGEDRDALESMRSAADLEDSMDKHPVTPGPVLPARELLGDLLVELGRPAEAVVEYERSLARSPGRFNSLAGAGRAAAAAGDRAKARQFYEKLAAQCRGAETDRSELDEARAFLAPAAKR